MGQKSKISCLIVVNMLIAGCATVSNEQAAQRIQAWKSMPVEQLIKYWGLPTNQKKIGQNHYAEWVNRNKEEGNASVSVGGGGHRGNVGGGVGISFGGIGGSDDFCSRTVVYADDGQISEIRWQGDTDYCYKLTPHLDQVLAKQPAAKTQQSN